MFFLKDPWNNDDVQCAQQMHRLLKFRHRKHARFTPTCKNFSCQNDESHRQA